MRLTTIASGSSGNCALLETETGALLIDAGLTCKRISVALNTLRLSPASLRGILITHEHSDHISGLPVFVRQTRVPVYAPGAVCAYLHKTCAIPQELLFEVFPGERFSICGVEALAFRTPHDAAGSVGYRLACGTDSLGYCTDLGHVTDEVLEALRGVRAAVIECNHDTDMLRYGPYPAYLKKRIASDVGHLSNRLGAVLAEELAKSGAAELVLAHLSEHNNTPELALRAVTERLAASEDEAVRSCKVYIAPRDGFHTICSASK
ncbi:MAG: MBL fold metallo-hydrolase [Firmicutes bacterium]|nr:MBL fold metallo-hydrolase [Bacillota bacterium]